jgi:hypothetical protein
VVALTALSEVHLCESNYFIVIIEIVSERISDVFLQFYLAMFI